MLRTKSLTYSTARYIISTISTATARTNGVNRTLQLYVELLGPEAHDELESLKYYLQTEECQEWEPARSCNLSISISCINNYSLREPYHPFSFFFLPIWKIHWEQCCFNAADNDGIIRDHNSK